MCIRDRYMRDRQYVKDSAVYVQYWDTTTLFPYRDVTLASLPASVAIDLVDSLKCYHYPGKGKLRSKYGPRRRRQHQGVDIPLKMGEPVYAVFNGRVRISQYNRGGYGNLVVIRHDNGLETFSGHLSERLVQSGDWVEAGQIIGFCGSTGRSTGPHLHFETRYCGQTFDPERLIDFESGNLLQRAKALIPLFVPLFVSAFRRADELATAMECRCYHGGEGRTKLHVLRYETRDYLTLAFYAALCAAMIALKKFF